MDINNRETTTDFTATTNPTSINTSLKTIPASLNPPTMSAFLSTSEPSVNETSGPTTHEPSKARISMEQKKQKGRIEPPRSNSGASAVEKNLSEDFDKYIMRRKSFLDCGSAGCFSVNQKEHFHCKTCENKVFVRREEMMRHFKWHKKRDESLQHGFLRFIPTDNCEPEFGSCAHNGRQTHYHCIRPGCLKVYISTSDVQMHANFHRKDSAILQEGFQRFKATEDCGMPAQCSFHGQRTTHFHCVRQGCRFTFKNKADMEKHKAYHQKDEELARDGFKKFMKYEICSFPGCQYSNVSNHIHCIRPGCVYILHSTGQLNSHKRKHEKRDLELHKMGTSSSTNRQQAQLRLPSTNPRSNTVSTGLHAANSTPSAMGASFINSPAAAAAAAFAGLVAGTGGNPFAIFSPPASVVSTAASTLPVKPVSPLGTETAADLSVKTTKVTPSSLSLSSVQHSSNLLKTAASGEKKSSQSPSQLSAENSNKICVERSLRRYTANDYCYANCSQLFKDHLHCTVDGCTDVFWNKDGVNEHLKFHDMQEQCTSLYYKKTVVGKKCESCARKSTHFHCLWPSCTEVIELNDGKGAFNRLEHYRAHQWDRSGVSTSAEQNSFSSTSFTGLDQTSLLKRKSPVASGCPPRRRGRPPKFSQSCKSLVPRPQAKDEELKRGYIEYTADQSCPDQLCIHNGTAHFHCLHSKCHSATDRTDVLALHLQDFHNHVQILDGFEFFDRDVNCRRHNCSNSTVNRHFHCTKPRCDYSFVRFSTMPQHASKHKSALESSAAKTRSKAPSSTTLTSSNLPSLLQQSAASPSALAKLAKIASPYYNLASVGNQSSTKSELPTYTEHMKQLQRNLGLEQFMTLLNNFSANASRQTDGSNQSQASASAATETGEIFRLLTAQTQAMLRQMSAAGNVCDKSSALPSFSLTGGNLNLAQYYKDLLNAQQMPQTAIFDPFSTSSTDNLKDENRRMETDSTENIKLKESGSVTQTEPPLAHDRRRTTEVSSEFSADGVLDLSLKPKKLDFPSPSLLYSPDLSACDFDCDIPEDLSCSTAAKRRKIEQESNVNTPIFSTQNSPIQRSKCSPVPAKTPESTGKLAEENFQQNFSTELFKHWALSLAFAQFFAAAAQFNTPDPQTTALNLSQEKQGCPATCQSLGINPAVLASLAAYQKSQKPNLSESDNEDTQKPVSTAESVLISPKPSPNANVPGPRVNPAIFAPSGLRINPAVLAQYGSGRTQDLPTNLTNVDAMKRPLAEPLVHFGNCGRPFCKLKRRQHYHCVECNQAFSEYQKLQSHMFRHSNALKLDSSLPESLTELATCNSPNSPISASIDLIHLPTPSVFPDYNTSQSNRSRPNSLNEDSNDCTMNTCNSSTSDPVSVTNENDDSDSKHVSSIGNLSDSIGLDPAKFSQLVAQACPIDEIEQSSSKTSSEYTKYYTDEDCNISRCSYRFAASHFHCMLETGCHYAATDKNRMIQHALRHQRLTAIMGDSFTQYRQGVNCKDAKCSMCAKQTHFHCNLCDFVCVDSENVIVHRNVHTESTLDLTV